MYKIFGLLLLLSNSLCIGQNPDPDGKPYTIGRAYPVFDFDAVFYLNRENQTLALKFLRDRCQLQKFDLNELTCAKITRNDNLLPSGFTIENALEVAGDIYFFYSLKKDGRVQLWAQKIDFETVDFTGSPQLLQICRKSLYPV